MKKIFTLILASMALALPMTAQGSDDKSNQTPITLSTLPLDSDPTPTIFRAPMRICVEAWYYEATSMLSIIYYGEAEGEVNLYRDGELIETSSTINTSFMIADSGSYTIEIITEAWTATGSLEI